MKALVPYMAFAKKSFLGRSAYRFDHLIGILNSILKIFIFWGIYSALYGDNAQIDGITPLMVNTNFLLTAGLGAVFHIDGYFLPSRINDGTVSNELLRPVSFRGRMLSENMGNALFNLIFHFFPVAVISAFTIGISPPAGIKALPLFIVSAFLGYGVLWSISFAVQTSAFWIVNVWSLNTIKDVFINVLSGSMIPLWFMPDWMNGVLRFTPFSSIYFTPVQIYLGELEINEIFQRCLIQLLWIVILFSLGNLLWVMGRKKLVVQGG